MHKNPNTTLSICATRLSAQKGGSTRSWRKAVLHTKSVGCGAAGRSGSTNRRRTVARRPRAVRRCPEGALGKRRRAAGRERVVTRGRGFCRPTVLLPPLETPSYHKKVTNISRQSPFGPFLAPFSVPRLLVQNAFLVKSRRYSKSRSKGVFLIQARILNQKSSLTQKSATPTSTLKTRLASG